MRNISQIFQNIGNFRLIDFGNSFGSMESILKAPSILCQFPNYIASMLNSKNFEGTTLIHAPHTCSSKHFVISMSLSIHKSKTNTIVLQEKCFCKKIHIVSLMHTIGSLIEDYFLYEIIIFVGQKADES
jgi:hypothetical protein